MAKESKQEVINRTFQIGNIIYKTVTEEMRNKLNAPLPKEAIKSHPTKTYLSSIKAIFVTERLNDVFGIGAWQLRSNLILHIAETGTVVTHTELTIPEYNIHYESFGGNDNGGSGSKNFDLGDAFKGSVTDAITKICSYMEIGIDVFKGLNNAPKPTEKPKPEPKQPVKPETPKAPVSKPTLNPQNKQWEPTIEKLKNGVTIETVKSFFTISQEDERELIKLSTK